MIEIPCKARVYRIAIDDNDQWEYYLTFGLPCPEYKEIPGDLWDYLVESVMSVQQAEKQRKEQRAHDLFSESF